MPDLSDYGPWAPIYIFVGDDGEQVTVDTNALYEWVQAQTNLKVWSVPLEEGVVKEMFTDGALQPSRVQHMLMAIIAEPKQFSDPIVFLKTGSKTGKLPDVLLCDGHHRYTVRYARGEKLIDSIVLEPEQWQPFVINGIPQRTQEQVRRMLPRAAR